MIQIGRKTYELNQGESEIIDQNLNEHTCKTNINPQLMFRQSYTGETSKIFVGNWKENGFWISKFHRQLLNLRPDIIARFTYQGIKKEKLIVKFSIGLSSLISAFLVGVIFMILIIQLFNDYILESWIVFFVIYILSSRYALKKMKRAISDKIMNFK